MTLAYIGYSIEDYLPRSVIQILSFVLYFVQFPLVALDTSEGLDPFTPVAWPLLTYIYAYGNGNVGLPRVYLSAIRAANIT